MARPKPTVLLDRVDKHFRCEEVLRSENVYAVFYDGEPISLKTYHKLINKKPPKYKNCSQKKDPLGNPIITQECGGRTLHWCPAVQV